jgi:two-component system chemotaxis response regulator CheB
MARRDIIVIGTSAGGVQALSEVVHGLPSGFPASLFIVCHFPAGGRSVLPEILSRAGPLLATHPADGDRFYPGQIYVAPPGRHLLLAPRGRMRLSRRARENHHRPAADPLFRSAARYYGARVIGVVLTGSLCDGTAGLMAVRAAGGLAVVQDPGDALVAAMPQNAARIAGVDHMVSVEELAPLLVQLVQEPVTPDRGDEPMDPMERMNEIVDQDMARQAANGRRGEVSVFTCPECGGALWQVDETGLVRFRCHVGHAYQAEVLLSEQTEALEAALWTAVRTFKEKCVLATQLANHERAEGDAKAAARFEEQAQQSARFGHLIEHFLLNGGPPGEGRPDAPQGDGQMGGSQVQQSRA